MPIKSKVFCSYCGRNATNDEREAVSVEADSNWGFCNKHCSVRDPLTQILQEVKLSLVPKYSCARLGRELNVSTSRELCAGRCVTESSSN